MKTTNNGKKTGYLADNEQPHRIKPLKPASAEVDIETLAHAFAHKNKISASNLSPFEEGLNAFAAHISKISGVRNSQNLSELNRRLDSLARLIEQDSTCAAVYYCPEMKSILVATNTLHSNSRKTNGWMTQIQRVFQLITQCELDITQLIEVLSEAIVVHIQHEERHLWIEQSKKPPLIEAKSYISNHLQSLFDSGLSTKAWRDHMLENPNLNDGLTTTRLYSKIIKRTSRIARDFLKLRESLHKTIAEQGSLDTLFYSALKNNQFTLWKKEKKNMHAEMRLSHYVKQKNATMPCFGISKLCCAYCNLGLYAINTEDLYTIKTRGQHGQIYKWILPDFIKNNSEFLARFLGKIAYESYQKLIPEDKIKFIDAIETAKIPVTRSKVDRAMVADSSESDVEFGINCEDDESLKEVAYEQKLSDIPHLRELTQDSTQEYQNLTKAGISARKVFSLFKESPEKLGVLGHASSAAVIAEGSDADDALSDLDNLFTRDKNAFHEVVEDEENAIGEFGRETFFRYVREEIDNKSSSEEGDFLYASTPYERAYARALEENGLEYAVDSEGEYYYPDSDNSVGYRS